MNISKNIKEQCIQYGLPYYETSYNREKVLNDFVGGLVDTNEK